jgi:hypothetical protein
MAFRAKDPVAYAKGELVEPIKPIVYYIDPATQKNFVNTSRYRRMAKPFETAGFKNAIIAKDPPTKEEDPILVQRIWYW